MAQKKPVRSLDSLSSLLSDTDKEKLRKEKEDLDKRHKKALEAIQGLATDLVKKKIGEKVFNEMYDTLTLAKTKFLSGTDKDGDYIIVNKNKFIRTDEVAATPV